MTEEKNVLVWIALEVSSQNRKMEFTKAITFPVTWSMAEVIRKLLEVEYPNRTFAVSVSQPSGFYW